MCKALKPFLLTILLSACFMVSVSAKESIDINSLINNAESLNNKTVTIQGEAIGELLERGEYAWVNISDGTNAIGIWMKASDAKTIEYFGDYKHVGDTLKITGVFTRDCSAHGGDVDIHLSTMEIIKKGCAVNEEVSNTKVITAGIFSCVALIIACFYIKSARKQKRP